MQHLFCVHFHAWFKKIIIIKSEFASYFFDDHFKKINRLISVSNISLKKRLFFVTNRYDRNPPVTGNMHIPESKTVYCSLYENLKKKRFQCNNQCSLHINTLWTYVSALILKHGYLPTRFHQSVQNFCFSFTVEHRYDCFSGVMPRWYLVSWL